MEAQPELYPFEMAVVADMDASDTVKLQYIQGSGTQQSDITGDSSFSGYLVC